MDIDENFTAKDMYRELIPVYTLSFKEYLMFKDKAAAEARTVFDEYLQYGGFPIIGISSFDTRSAYQVVEGIYAAVITRDISIKYSKESTWRSPISSLRSRTPF